MTDGAALYRSILVNPADDTPRLVYADWLEENGRAEEAEFIRVECRLHADVPDDTDLIDRQEELRLWLRTHMPGPKMRFPAGLKVASGADWWAQTRRGFPCFIEYEGINREGLRPIREMAAALQTAFATVPTRWLVVRFVTVEQLSELLRQPVIAGLQKLTIQLGASEEPRDEVGRMLGDCRHVRNLEGLALAFSIGPAGVEGLARSEHLSRLRQLVLEPAALTPASVDTLAGSEWFGRLFELSMNDNCPAQVFERLCEQKPFPNLHLLDLTDNVFHGTSWRAFARSKSFPALAEINLSRTDLSGEGFAALVSANWFRPIALNLSACAIGNEGAFELARSNWVEALDRLDLRHNSLGAVAATAIGRCARFSRLKHLDLGYNAIGASTLQAIAANPALRNLTALELYCHFGESRGLEPDHFREFFDKLNMPYLRHLNLSGRPVGARAARLLANEKFHLLRRLDLSGCGLNDAAVSRLLAAPSLKNLIELEVGQNGLKTGVSLLTDRGVLPRLSKCNLQGSPLNGELKARLTRRPGITM